MGGGPKTEQPQGASDQPVQPKPGATSDAVRPQEWNEKAVRGTEHKRQRLSPEEAQERRSRARPGDGMAFDYNRRTLPKGEYQRWYQGLSSQDRALLAQPGTRIEIYASASRPGSDQYNQKLSKDRAEAVAVELNKQLGIPRSQIKPQGLGEDPAVDNLPPGFDPGRFENVDNREDRAAQIVIVPAESSRKTGIDTGDAKKAGTEAGKKAKIDKPSPKYTPEEGMKDLPKFVKDYKKVIAESVKRFFKAVHEAHRLNEQASHACGVRYAVDLIQTDATPSSRSPHTEKGEPYSGDDLWKRMEANPIMKAAFYREMTSHLVENTNGKQTAKQAMRQIADTVNKLLQKAGSPEQRRALLNEFCLATLKQLAENKRKRAGKE